MIEEPTCGTPGCGGFDIDPCCADGLQLHDTICRRLAISLCEEPADDGNDWPAEIVPTPAALTVIWHTLTNISSVVRPHMRILAELVARQEGPKWGDTLDWATEQPDMIWRASVNLGRDIHRITTNTNGASHG